ncbi:MAG: hypothetical protein AAF481_02545 [Acidobacteriota bacterium]
MPASQSAPLGLSDLTEDECLVVSISRAWRRLGPTQAVAEHSIARLLQKDRIYPALDALFATFGPLFADEPAEADASDLLSRSEQALLDRLTAEDVHQRQPPEVRACRAALGQARIELRPLGSIERSGYDRLMDRMSRSYQISMRRPM